MKVMNEAEEIVCRAVTFAISKPGETIKLENEYGTLEVRYFQKVQAVQ